MKNVASLLLICLFIFFHQQVLDAREKKEKGFVTTSLGSQLGNQLFFISSALAYGWDHNLDPYFPFLNETDANKQFNRDHLFFRLNVSNYPRPIKKTWESKWGYYQKIPSYKDVYIGGCLFFWKYFHHYRDKLLALYAPSNEILQYLYDKYGDVIEYPLTVGIHVRTFSQKIHEMGGKFVGLKYYEMAMGNFPPETLFVVFSDRIKWCKKNFPEKFPDKKFVFIEDNDHIQDLFLYSMMKSHIISNSTYSWWGAYLCTNPNQKVYAPLWFICPPHVWSMTDYYLPHWIIVPYDFQHETYPADMYFYDEVSQSVHERNG